MPPHYGHRTQYITYIHRAKHPPQGLHLRHCRLPDAQHRVDGLQRRTLQLPSREHTCTLLSIRAPYTKPRHRRADNRAARNAGNLLALGVLWQDIL